MFGLLLVGLAAADPDESLVLLQLRSPRARTALLQAPPERVSKHESACVGSAPGAACSVKNRRGKVFNGICGDAGEGKAASGKCTFVSPDGSAKGKCFTSAKGLF